MSLVRFGLEKRFEQFKSVHEIAPVLLKNPSRIEAFFTGKRHAEAVLTIRPL